MEWCKFGIAEFQGGLIIIPTAFTPDFPCRICSKQIGKWRIERCRKISRGLHVFTTAGYDSAVGKFEVKTFFLGKICPQRARTDVNVNFC